MKISENEYYEAIFENEEITSNGKCPDEALTEELVIVEKNRVIISNYDYQIEQNRGHCTAHYPNAEENSIYDY